MERTYNIIVDYTNLLWVNPLPSVTIRFKTETAQYSYDSHNWTNVNISSGSLYEDITFTRLVFIRLNGQEVTNESKGFDAIAGLYEIGGDVRQIKQADYTNHHFKYWFKNDTYLKSAESLNFKNFIQEAKSYYLENYPAAEFIINFTECFSGCTNLIKAPKLKELGVIYYNNTSYSVRITYSYMFYDCSSLLVAPDIEIATQPAHCQCMFQYCTSLKKLPSLGAIINYADLSGMFYGCVNLEEVYDFSHGNITEGSFASMFNGCTKIKISRTQTDSYINALKVTQSGSTYPNLSLTNMFANTGGSFTDTPTPGTTYYTSNNTINIYQINNY